MKLYTYIIAATLFLSIFFQPLLEIGLVCREKIAINSAISNAVRAARLESYTYTDMRDVDATVNKKVFMEEFSKIFSSALNLREAEENSITGILVFKSIDGNYNDFKVNIKFEEKRLDDHTLTYVRVRSESKYKFKTKYLKQAATSIEDKGGAYMLAHERSFTLKMTN